MLWTITATCTLRTGVLWFSIRMMWTPNVVSAVTRSPVLLEKQALLKGVTMVPSVNHPRSPPMARLLSSAEYCRAISLKLPPERITPARLSATERAARISPPKACGDSRICLALTESGRI